MTAVIERPTIEDVVAKKYTVADTQAPAPVGDNYELINGVWIEMPGQSGIHSRIITKLARYIDTYASVGKLGQTFSQGPVALTTNNEPRPDVSFVAAGKLPDYFSGPISVLPDLVIEVNSPSDTTEGIHDKLIMYREAGVPLIWSVFMLDKYVLVHRLNDLNIQLLNLNDELNGEDVIPGFKLKVSTIFEQ